MSNRREFLKLLAASPLVAGLPVGLPAVARVLAQTGEFVPSTPAFKALALGATAVGIGRPYLYGLAAFGQPGVERALDIFRRELTLIMGQCGVSSLKQLGSGSIVRV